jgi:Uma2 family endonuclease
MNMPFKPRLFTVDEFMDLSAKGVFEHDMGDMELHDGQIVHMNAKHLPHMTLQSAMFRAIANMLHGASPLQAVLEVTVQFDRYNAREPDISVYVPGAHQKTVLYPQDLRLLIEVSGDNLATDMGEKADLYARADVPDYWVVDLQSQVTHVHGGPSANGYASRSVVRFDEPLRSDILPAPLILSEIN